jgi:hypothetical protein
MITWIAKLTSGIVKTMQSLMQLAARDLLKVFAKMKTVVHIF